MTIMKKYRNIAFAFMAIAAIACSKVEAPENEGSQNGPVDDPAVEVVPTDMTFEASLEGVTRVTFDGTSKSIWEADDMISIYDGEANRCFEAGEAGETTVFAGKALEADAYWAHYPYSEDVVFADGAILTSIPSVQTAVKGTFDDAAAVAVAYGANDAGLAFKNLASMLTFEVAEDVTITSLTISGNAAEKIAGDVSVTFGQDGLPVLADAATSATSVSLTGEMTAGVYYVLVRPGNYSGLTAVVTYAGGESVEVPVDEPVTLDRSAYTYIGKISKPAEEPKPLAPQYVFLGLAETVDALDPESKAAATWMLQNFEGSAYLQIAKIPETDLSQCDVMWWHYHKDWGLDGKFNEFAADAVNVNVMNAVKEWRNAGGALFLSRYATYWAPMLDMVGGEWKFPGTIFGGTEAGDSGWFCDGMAAFFSTDEVANSVYFTGCKMDENDDNAWKVVANNGEYYYSNQHCLYETGGSIWDWWTEQNGNVLLAHEGRNVWNEEEQKDVWVDRSKAIMWECTYNKSEQAGKVVCFGSPVLDFYEYMGRWNEYHNNVYIIAQNTLRHLAE